MNKKKLNLLLLFITIFFVTSFTKVNADDIDLMVIWQEGQTNFHNKYEDLPDEIKKLLPSKPTWDSYPPPTGENPYSGHGYQCTWYAYNRAKQQGREYSAFEGDGGYWHLDISNYGQPTGTTALDKPTPQVAASITGGGDVLGASGAPGHVIYIEYVDSKGNLLISEGNVYTGNGGDSFENYRIIYHGDPNFDKLKFVSPLNKDSIEDFGKNPDGSKISSEEGTKNSKEEGTEDSGLSEFNPFRDKHYQKNNLGVQSEKGVLDKDTILKLSGISDTLVGYLKYIVFVAGAILLLFVFSALAWYIAVPKLGYNILDKLDGFFGVDNDRTASNTRHIAIMVTGVSIIVGIVLSGIYIYPIIGILTAIQALL